MDECGTLCNKKDSCKGFTYIPSKHDCWLKNKLKYPTQPHAEALTYYRLHEGKFSIFEHPFHETVGRLLKQGEYQIMKCYFGIRVWLCPHPNLAISVLVDHCTL